MFYLLFFALSFFSVNDGKRWKKLVLAQKQMILTSKRSAEHRLAGQNTQHLGDLYLNPNR